MLLYLGRLKRYKRIELLLDVLEQIPEATLEMAGEGDHREAIEHEIARRGLAPRVLMHGHVSEEKKLELLQRAWANMTASSAEGWCLTVMEAAACETPSVAMAVGGLPESIADGETGLLARTPEELVEKTRLLVQDAELRERLGARARERAREFTWDRAAERNLHLLRGGARAAGGSSLAGAQPGAHGHRARGRARRLGDRGQRDRARLHGRLRARARRERLRLAGRPAVRLHHPDGPRLGPSDRRRQGREHRRGVGPRECRRRSPTMARAPPDRDGGGSAARDPAAPCARRGPERRRGLGRGRGAGHGDALDGGFGRARRAPGAPALPARGLEHHRRGRRTARLRPSPRGHRTRRDRRLPRKRAGARGRWRCCWRYRCSGRCRTAKERGCATCSPAPGCP